MRTRRPLVDLRPILGTDLIHGSGQKDAKVRNVSFKLSTIVLKALTRIKIEGSASLIGWMQDRRQPQQICSNNLRVHRAPIASVPSSSLWYGEMCLVIRALIGSSTPTRQTWFRTYPRSPPRDPHIPRRVSTPVVRASRHVHQVPEGAYLGLWKVISVPIKAVHDHLPDVSRRGIR